MQAREQFMEAQRLLIEGKHAESVEAFTKAIEMGSEPFISYLSRGAAYIQLKEADKAIEDFTRAIGAKPDNFRPYYYRGAAYMVKEDYKSAIKDFTKVIELNPDHGASFFARGTCFTQLGLDEEAERDIKTAITYSEAAVQGFIDSYGILRTQFDSVMAFLSGERSPGMRLTEEETEKLRKWLQEEE